MAKAVIVDSVRTGLAKSFRGGFNQTRADNMTAHLVDSLMDRNPQVNPSDVEDMILGCGAPEGAQGHNIARNVAVLSKLPIEVGGTTVNRYCSSGLQTVAMAATQVQSGFTDCIIAGGVESISTTQGKSNTHMYVNEKLAEEVPGIYHAMGTTAETVAKRYGVTRESQDEYALSSQERCAKAQDQGLFDDEIIPMETKMLLVNKETGAEKEVDTVVDRDNCNRPETTLEGLASLNPVFDPEEGSVTAGNSSGIVDGAAAVLIGNKEIGKKYELKPRAKIRSFASIGSEPTIMLTGPADSAEKALKKAKMKASDIDLFEMNEAFAAVVLRFMEALKVDHSKVNVNGGAIALGHPLGATGAMILGTVLDELERRDLSTGLITLCVGAGMGTATIIERM